MGAVPLQDVEDAMQKMPPTTIANQDQNALNSAMTYRRRRDLRSPSSVTGARRMDYSASSPASVTFSLKFADMKTQQIRMDRQVCKIAGSAFRKRFRSSRTLCSVSGRWVRAHEIALEA